MASFNWDEHPDAPETNNKPFNWDDHPDDENNNNSPSKLESFGRGLAQGASLGFADEGTGLGEAALDEGKKLIDPNDSVDNFQDFLKRYQQHRDESRASYEKAKKANPGTYFAGTLAGGVGLGAATAGLGAEAAAANGVGKLGNVVNTGARLGAIAGLGTSDTDLTGNQTLADKAKGTLTNMDVSGVAGGILAAVPTVVGAGASKVGNALADTNAGKSFLRGMNGEVIDSNFPAQVGKKLTDFSSGFTKKLQDFEQLLARQKGEAIRTSPDKIDVSDARNAIETGLNKVDTNVGGFNDTKQKVLDDVGEAFGDKTKENVTTILKHGGASKDVPYSPSALEQLQEEAAKETAGAKALGQTIKHEFIPSDDGKYITKVSYTDEPIEAPERVSSGESDEDTSLLNADEPKYKTTAKQKTVENTPATYGQSSVEPTEQTVLEKVRNNEQLTPKEAQLLNSRLNIIKGSSSVRDIPELSNPISQGQSKITDLINDSDSIAPINKKITSINAARNAVGIESDFGSNRIDFNQNDPRQFILGDKIKQSAGNLGGAPKANAQLELMQNSLNEANPDLANELKNTLPGLQEDYQIAGAINPDGNFSKSNILKQILVRGANPTGRAVGSIQPFLSKAGTAASSVATPVIENSAIVGKTYGAKDVSNASNVPKTEYLRNSFTNKSPQQLQDIANKLRASNQTGIAAKVEQAAQDPNNSLKSAQADFVVQQNPMAKQELTNHNDDEVANAINSLRMKYGK